MNYSGTSAGVLLPNDLIICVCGPSAAWFTVPNHGVATVGTYAYGQFGSTGSGGLAINDLGTISNWNNIDVGIDVFATSTSTTNGPVT